MSHTIQAAYNPLKRRKMLVDLIELEHYGGLALCANDVVNFKIGRASVRESSLES